MPSPSDRGPEPIPPALSLEDWRRAHAKRDHGPVYHEEPEYMYGENDAAGCAYMVAIANDAAPADSPYKITREDVGQLLDAHSAFDWAKRQEYAGILTVAAKLALLLPPETL